MDLILALCLGQKTKEDEERDRVVGWINESRPSSTSSAYQRIVKEYLGYSREGFTRS